MTENLKTRNNIDPKYQWNLEDFYKTPKDWETTYNNLKANIQEMKQFQDHLSDSKETLISCFTKHNQFSLVLDQLYTYANMKLHEDSQNESAQALVSRADMLLVEYSTLTSFLIPEVLTIPKNTIEAYLQDDDFKLYQHFFHSIFRKQAHMLSKEEEKLLAKASELTESPQNIFTMLNDADISFPNIQNENGDWVELTKGRYTTFLENKDQKVRQSAFSTLYNTYEKQKNTLATTYISSVKSDVFKAQVRNYDSSLAMALADDNIPLSVYDNLIDTVNKHLPLLHRYIDIRKKELGLDELHLYDLYTPLVPELDINIPYEEAVSKVEQSLKILGKEYQDALHIGLNNGWIDIYENKGKRGGAYSWGSYGVHPYVLLNHNDTINSMFTLAHEMGHALHSYFTWQKQPYLYSGHKIFVAEVASTCNEALLMDYLLNTTPDKKTRKYLINYFLEQFRGTLFRQTMFAEFEKMTHAMIENQEPLTCEILNQIYLDLNKRYFGNNIIIDDAIKIEWARIPHFYNAFYVYQYATGYSAAIALAQKIQIEGNTATKSYLEFLSKGDSEYSIDLLKGAGVDLSSPKPIENALSLFEKLLNEFETL